MSDTLFNMNPSLSNVVLGVVANGVTWAISAAIAGIREAGEGNGVADTLLGDTRISTVLQRATTRVATHAPEEAEALRLFIVSPSVDSIIRQVYSSLVLTDDRSAISVARELFIDEFMRQFPTVHSAQPSSASDLFDDLVEACDAAVQACIEDGVLAAHEAASAKRFQVLRDELVLLQLKIDRIGTLRPSPRDVQSFEQAYSAVAANRFGILSVPQLDSQLRVPLDKIYVTPPLLDPAYGQEEQEPYEFPAFLEAAFRLVVLGNPGGGKTTLAHKVCADALKPGVLIAGRAVVPFVVVLREYGVWRALGSSSIIEFIEQRATMQVRAPDGVVEELVRTGRAMVVFDGIDELVEVGARQAIRDEIEAFAHVNADCPMLITSRLIGYEKAPLSVERFRTILIGDFEEDQVEEYARKWFKLDTELPEELRTGTANDFIRDTAIVSDLRRNPLMLALMCNLYRGERYIPRNRPDVYEKCAVLLFEKWDASRGIRVPLPFEAHVDSAIKHLAHWIYSNPRLQEGVTASQIIDEAANYLCPRQFEDRDEAVHAARKFVEYCTGRAWVFTDTGSDEHGEGIFQFTHRTFLEYFTASYLVRLNPLPRDLAAILLPKIRSRSWDVVAQLAFQIQAKRTEGAADQLLQAVLDEVGRGKPDEASSLISFATRSLQYLVPVPKTVRACASTSIQFCISWVAGHVAATRPSIDDDSGAVLLPWDILVALASVRPDNLRVLQRTVEEELVNGCRSPQQATREAAAAIMFALPRGGPHSLVITQFAPEIESAVLAVARSDILALAQTSAKTAAACLRRGLIDLPTAVNAHGVELVLTSHTSGVHLGPDMVPFGAVLLSSVFTTSQSDHLAIGDPTQHLADFGRIVLQNKPPFVRATASGMHPRQWLVRGAGKSGPVLRDSPDAHFGAVVLLSINVENAVLSRRSSLATLMHETISGSTLAHYAPIVHHKVNEPTRSAESTKAFVSSLGFRPEQEALLKNWATGTRFTFSRT